MESDLYERGDAVRVTVGRGFEMRARVMLDTGGPTLIVGRKQPGDTKRVKREAVRPARPPKKVTKPKPKLPRSRPAVELHKLAIAPSPHGMCALQRQSRPPTKAEMIEGEWSICGTWIESRSAPQRGETTCPQCRTLLKMEPQ